MKSDEARFRGEQLARRMDWVLESQPEGMLHLDDHLAAEAAEAALAAMVEEYPWLTEWVALAEEAAKAAAVYQVANENGAPRLIQNRLGQAAAKAKTPLSNFHPPGDRPYEVIKTFVTLTRLATVKPAGYRDS